MARPEINLTIEDGALGTLPPSTDQIHVVMGSTSSGTADTPVSIATLDDLLTEFGYGPAVEAAAYSLSVSATPVIVVKTSITTPGALGAVTVDRVDVSTSVLTVAGPPFDTYEAEVEISTGGTVGAAGIAFSYSLDGGSTFSALTSLSLSGIYVIPNSGITLTFGAGTLDQGDVFTFAATQPLWNSTNLNDAFTALFADVQEWDFVHAVGRASAAVASAVDLQMVTAANVKRYVASLLEARDQAVGESASTWRTSLQNDFASFAATSRGIAVGSSYCRLTSAVSGRQYRRPIMWAAAARAVVVPVGVDLARVLDGPLVGVTALFHDERANPQLDAQRFLTGTTILGKSGFFVTNPNMMSPQGSDFDLLQLKRVMNKACRTLRAVMLDVLSSSVRVGSTGFIIEKDAREIESRLTAALEAALVAPGDASAARGVVSRTDNILSTKTLTVTARIRPLGYIKTIDATIGFENPATQLVAA